MRKQIMNFLNRQQNTDGETPSNHSTVSENHYEDGPRRFKRRSIYEIVTYDIERRQQVDWIRPNPDTNPLGAAYQDALDLVFKIRTSMRLQAQKYRREQREREAWESSDSETV